MPPALVLMTAWTFALGTLTLAGQEMSGLVIAADTTAGPVEAADAGASPSSLGPTRAVLPRAEVSPDRALAAGAEADAIAPSRRLPVQLGLTLAGYYDDNIYVRPGEDRVGDFIYEVVPYVAWNSARDTGVDNSVQLSYAPGFVFYQEHPGNDTFEQTGTFVYGFHGTKSDLSVVQQYASVQNSAPDLGDLVKLQEYVTTIDFDYALTAKLGLTVRAQQQIISYDRGFDSNQWTGSVYLNDEFRPKTTLALGTVVGHADLEGPNQDFVQANGRVLYTPTEKLSFNATAGAEFRQTAGSSAFRVTPVFSGGFSYTPWDETSLTLDAYREYNYSAKYFGQDYLATGTSASLTQGIFHQLDLILTGSFETAHYENNLEDDDSGGHGYDYYALRAALDYKVKEWCELSAYYQYRRDVAHATSGFIDNQAGFQSRFIY